MMVAIFCPSVQVAPTGGIGVMSGCVVLRGRSSGGREVGQISVISVISVSSFLVSDAFSISVSLMTGPIQCVVVVCSSCGLAGGTSGGERVAEG